MDNIISTWDYNRSIENSGKLNGEGTGIWELYDCYTQGYTYVVELCVN